MKFIIGLLLVCGVGAAAVYYFGGYSSFDPSEQGRQAKKAIEDGMAKGPMTWNQVVAAAGEPRTYRPWVRIGKNIKLGPDSAFSADRLAERVKNREMPLGFVFRYHFSADVVFDVDFDPAGVAERVQKQLTMSDLLQGDTVPSQ